MKPDGGTVAGEVDANRIEEITNSVADTIDGTVMILKDIGIPYSEDMRLHTCIAALRNARDQLEPLLEIF